MIRGLLILTIFLGCREIYGQSKDTKLSIEKCLSLIQQVSNFEEIDMLPLEMSKLLQIEKDIMRTVETQRIESLFLLSLRLSEMDELDKAREWAYRAGIRMDLLRLTLKPSKLRESDSKEKILLRGLKEIKLEMEQLLWGEEEIMSKEKYDFLKRQSSRMLRILNYIEPMNENYEELEFVDLDTFRMKKEELGTSIEEFRKYLELVSKEKN